MYWIYTPKKTQTLARFETTDPWNGDQRTSFQLDRCFAGGFVPDYAAFDEQSIPHRYALKSALDREHRALPDSLAALWRDGRVAPENLPRLLGDLQPELERSDFFRLMTMNRLQRGIRTYAFLVLGVVVSLLGLGSMLMSPPEPAAGVVLIGAGVLFMVFPIRFVRGWQARRTQQMKWALERAMQMR